MAEYEIEVKCKNCGKAIAVLAPSRWGYKKRRSYGGGWDYFCTWKCLREDEKKHEIKQKAVEEEKQTAAYRDREAELQKLIREVKNGKDPYEYLKKAGYANPKDTMRRLRLQAKDEWPELYTEMVKLGLKDMRKGNGKKMGPNRMTPENKAKAVDIAIAGGDYIAHLKECGAKNPHASWSYIKQQLSREDPAKYDELMEALAKAEPKVIITKQLPKEAQRLTHDFSEHQPEPQVNWTDEIHEYDVAEHPEKKPGTEVKTKLVMTSNGIHITREPEANGLIVTSIRGRFGTYKIEGEKSMISIYYEPMKIYEHMVLPIVIGKEEINNFLNEIRTAVERLGVDI